MQHLHFTPRNLAQAVMFVAYISVVHISNLTWDTG